MMTLAGAVLIAVSPAMPTAMNTPSRRQSSSRLSAEAAYGFHPLLGGHLGRRIPQQRLRPLFAGVLVVVAAGRLWQTLASGSTA